MTIFQIYHNPKNFQNENKCIVNSFFTYYFGFYAGNTSFNLLNFQIKLFWYFKYFQSFDGIDLSSYSDCFENLPIAESFIKIVPDYTGKIPTTFIELANTGVLSTEMVVQLIQICEYIRQTGTLGPYQSLVQG